MYSNIHVPVPHWCTKVVYRRLNNSSYWKHLYSSLVLNSVWLLVLIQQNHKAGLLQFEQKTEVKLNYHVCKCSILCANMKIMIFNLELYPTKAVHQSKELEVHPVHGSVTSN